MPGHGRPQAATRLTEAIDPSEQDDDRLGRRHQPSTPALARSSRAVARSMRRAAALDEHELSGGARASSRTRIHTIYRAHSYRIPGQRHPTIVAASFLLKETPGGAVIDLMSSHPTLCGRILTRFEEEVAALGVPASVRSLAVKKARFYLCDRGLQRLRTELQEMASATSHRAFCSCVPRRIPCTGRGVPPDALLARASSALPLVQHTPGFLLTTTTYWVRCCCLLAVSARLFRTRADPTGFES